MNTPSTALKTDVVSDIVVVDDTLVSLKLLTDILSNAGYHVRSASDGALVLRSIYAKPPALILLDIKMPDMNGFEICTRLKADERTRDIPIIFLTALSDIQDRMHGFALGASDYITKPFQTQDVLMRVQVHTNLFRAQTQLKQQNLAFERINQQLIAEITARKQAEEQLKIHQENLEIIVEQRTCELIRANEKYQALFLEARDGIVLIDVDTGIVVDANPELERQSGYSLAQLKTMKVWETLAANQVELGETLFQQIVASGSGRSDELNTVQPDGSLHPFEFMAKVIQLDGKHYVQAMIRDISERKRIEAERIASDKRFRQLFETMQEGSYLAELIFDSAGKAVDWRFLESNPAHALSLGMRREDIIGKTLSEVLPNIDNCWLDTAAHTALTGEPQMIESFGRVTNRHYECHYYSPCHGQIACIFNDVTEREQAAAERSNAQQKLQKALEDIIQALTVALETRDPYTAGHQKRVAKLAVMIAREMGLADNYIQGIHFSGLLHDIGKIAIPSEILNKPGGLSNVEYMLIQQHPQTGYDIIKDIDFPWPVAEIILQHHERIDGSGYPQGLVDGNILLEAKILAVADIIEAMSSHRPYRPGLGLNKSLAEIKRGQASCYDPQVVDACLKLFDEQGAEICAMLNFGD